MTGSKIGWLGLAAVLAAAPAWAVEPPRCGSSRGADGGRWAPVVSPGDAMARSRLRPTHGFPGVPIAASEGSIDEQLFLPGGEAAIFRLDLETGAIDATVPEELPLTDDAGAACALAPDWLWARCRLTLSYLDDELQDDVAALIAGFEGDVALDELIWGVAATTPDELAILQSYGILDVLADNAVGIYEAASVVEFAELVDRGVPGVDPDYHTTVVYHYEDGAGGDVSWELPLAHYYRYVVNPKLDMELVMFMDPSSGALDAPPDGVFWRSYFLEPDSYPEAFDYRTHYLQDRPRDVDDDEPSLMFAAGTLGDFEIDPLQVVVDDQGRSVLAEIDLGRGSVLATTIDLEGAYRDGVDRLMQNATRYVHRRDNLIGSEEVLILVDPDEPTGEMGQAFLEVLDANLLPAVVAAPGDAETLDLADYEKVIVPMGGSEAFYNDVVELEEELEALVSDGGTLLICAEPAASGGDPVALPGGFTATFDDAVGLSFLGHPVLGEALAGVTSVWDSQPYDGLSGSRALDDGTFALDAIGWWVTQNMFDNVSEYDATHADTERSVWAQRIVANHYGNCGECQDMITAAGRAALLPLLNVWSLEDHVWNQYYLGDTWYAYQVDWSDGPTRIDHPGVGGDGLFGGGKKVSGILGFRSNGFIEDEHVAIYTDTITVEVELTDADDAPVDGAMVTAWTDAYYYDDLLDQAAWVHTDLDGRATLTLGDERNYWIVVRAELDGEVEAYPFDLDEDTMYAYSPVYVKEYAVDEPFIDESAAIAGTTFTFAHRFEGRLGGPGTAQLAADYELSPQVQADLSLEITETVLDVPAIDTLLGWMADLGFAYGGRLIEALETPGTVDVYVVDAAGRDAFLDGDEFTALAVFDGVQQLAETVQLPRTEDDELFVIVSATGSGRHLHFGSFSLSFQASEAGDDGDGCQCSGATRRKYDSVVAPMSLLLLLALRRRGGRRVRR